MIVEKHSVGARPSRRRFAALRKEL